MDDVGTTTAWMAGTDGAGRPPGPDGLLCREYLALTEFEAAMHTPAWELFPYERSTVFVRELAEA